MCRLGLAINNYVKVGPGHRTVMKHSIRKPMNIAMLGSFPPLRGISSYCFELARSVASNTWHVDFISFKKMYPVFLYPGLFFLFLTLVIRFAFFRELFI